MLAAGFYVARGRNAGERINSVLTFTGQSLKGPKESTALLKLSTRAYDVDDLSNPARAKMTSAAGRAQALAMPFGKGRVLVFGEAAMLTAQNRNFGLNYPGTDDRRPTEVVITFSAEDGGTRVASA